MGEEVRAGTVSSSPAGINPGRVSVIIPSYNHARFVAECLASVAAETYPDIEVIMIDDGSSDGTFEAAETWRRLNPDAFAAFTLLKQPNQGLTRTLNRLISLARGQYICLLASDDRLLPGGIEARVRALRAAPHWRAVFGDCNVIDQDGRVFHDSGLAELYGADKNALSDPACIEAELIWRWSVPGPVLLVDRRIYEDADGYGPYPEGVVVEDRDFYLAALAKGQLGFVNAPVASYRLHGGNAIAAHETQIRSQNSASEFRLASRFSGWSRIGLLMKATAALVELKTRGSTGGMRLLRRASRRLDVSLTRWVLARNSASALAKRVGRAGKVKASPDLDAPVRQRLSVKG